MKWFKHDSNASIDAKIERLMIRYGLEGYGLYFYCLEMIARTVEKHNLTFELEHDAEIIAHRVGIHQDRIQEMMAFMVDLGLFENDRGVITCLKMATRTDEYTQKLIKDLDIIPTLSRQTPDSVGRKSELIEENRREENRRTVRRFTPPTVSEVSDYVNEKGYHVDAERFCNFYESKNWMVGKNKMQKWKAAVANWDKSNGNGKSVTSNQGYGETI